MSPNYDIENGADFRLRRNIACHSVLRSPFLPFRMKPETVVALLPVKAAYCHPVYLTYMQSTS